jgi:hypothetical protein
LRPRSRHSASTQTSHRRRSTVFAGYLATAPGESGCLSAAGVQPGPECRRGSAACARPHAFRFEKIATDPKGYQVTFLESSLGADVVRKLKAVATDGERVKHVGREVYAWHPDGVGRSKLAVLLAGKGLGVTATARNWKTVTRLLELADAGD